MTRASAHAQSTFPLPPHGNKFKYPDKKRPWPVTAVRRSALTTGQLNFGLDPAGIWSHANGWQNWPDSVIELLRQHSRAKEGC